MAMEMSWSSRKHIQDWVSLVCAALLFVSPWALRFAGDMMAARTAWVSAVVIAVLAIAAIVRFAEWEEWVTLLIGLWLIMAPWVVGFAVLTAAMATFVVLGIVVALSSISELWAIRHPSAAAH